MTKKLKRLLIANRGEIAVRIIRAAKAEGIETIAVYSEPDVGSLHVRLADRKVGLSGIRAKDSYLNIEKLLFAARQEGADALHPGYGFLSENSEFAAAVIGQGLNYVGPKPEVIASMGDKEQARALAKRAGVCVVPGTAGSEDVEFLAQEASRLGFPVMIKAVAGGSGRGMRVAQDARDFKQRASEAIEEARGAFSNGKIFVEKFIERPRHVEVQVFGDSFGTLLHVGARECSLQRRNQKLVEECPPVNLSPQVMDNLCQAALRLARAVGYQNAGTVEFLVEGGDSPDSAYYFLEMNTRIQVEHPVTELAYGVDLVREQLRVASGWPLSFSQESLCQRAHAMEFRLYAESPSRDFAPCAGEIRYLHRPTGLGIREDSWVESGSVVSPYYDALLSKLCFSAAERSRVLAIASVALNEYLIEGVPSTLEFHRWLLQQEDFLEGRVDIDWLRRNYSGEEVKGSYVGPVVLPVRTPLG